MRNTSAVVSPVVSFSSRNAGQTARALESTVAPSVTAAAVAGGSRWQSVFPAPVADPTSFCDDSDVFQTRVATAEAATMAGKLVPTAEVPDPVTTATDELLPPPESPDRYRHTGGHYQTVNAHHTPYNTLICTSKIQVIHRGRN